MPEANHGQTWLLLDPPAGTGYARRASLREKDGVPDAPFPSIDLILLSGHVREAGFDPRYIDAQIQGITWTQLNTMAREAGFRGVVSLVSSSRFGEELEALRKFKAVLGGAPVYVVASIYAALDAARCRSMLDSHPWLDGLILNTAENNFGEVIAGRSAGLHNLVLQGGGGAASAASVTYGEGLRIPRPQHAIFKDRRYFFSQTKHTPVTCVQMSFGCPFRCEFCLDNALYRKMRYRAVDDVVEELVEVDRLGFREVYFKDLTFGLSKRVTTELLEKLIARRLRLRWLCTTRVDVATPRLLELMRQAGCYGIEFGVESGIEQRRALNGKRVSDDDIRAVFNNCRRLGIETTAFVMLGFEDESEANIRTTTRFIESLRPDYASYNVVNALPGTPLEGRARAEGFLREDGHDLGFVRSNLRHKFLSPQRLEDLRTEAVRSFYRRPSTVVNRLLRTQSLFELRKLFRLGLRTLQQPASA